PASRAMAVGGLAAVPFGLTGSPIAPGGGAAGLISLSFLTRDVGVLAAPTRGSPRQGAWFKLGSWGTIINVIAIIWGGIMTINFALWSDTRLFGNFGSTLRTYTNPSLTALTSGGKPISFLPDIPFYEASVILILAVGSLYCAV